MVKKRTAKKSNRGIYLQDLQLKETSFKSGTHFKYIIDSKHKYIKIVPTTEKGNTVSKRVTKNTINPVIDIRNKKALSIFDNADQLEVEIYEDQILVRGLVEEKQNIITKVKNILLFKNKKTGTANKKVKKKIEVQFSKHQLRNAVGQDFKQLTIFDVIKESKIVSADSYFNTQSFKHALKNLNIPLQVISLFSGAGIMDQGFVEAGFEIKFALEKDKDAVKTYAYNIGKHIMQADIDKYDFTKFALIGAPIMIGGPPCQGLSSANRKTNFLENPNNRYIKLYIEAIKANPHCKVFVLENVEEILTAGNGRFKNEILSELSDFEITTGVINSADMGSAQSRKRAIFIGSKIGRIEIPKPIRHPGTYKTVRQAFEGLHDDLPNQMDVTKPRPETLEKMKYIPQGGNWTFIPDSLKSEKMKTGKTHSSIFKRLEYDKPSITITNVRKSNILHPIKNRVLSVRECARLFGLKDNFIFKGRLSSMQQQIANAVPVELAKSVALAIKAFIKKVNKKHDPLSPVLI
ncbi:hypothetical protein CH302_29465 [Rhodococcus sp. 15-2388-1-1a]|nr:hypothetical protein CH302_29465 [Rhodococcus sp. 15-2388-1-1a]